MIQDAREDLGTFWGSPEHVERQARLGSELRLITCGGEFDPASRHHLDNVVVYADLATRT